MVLISITPRDRTPLHITYGNLTGIRYRGEIIQRHVIFLIQRQKITLPCTRVTSDRMLPFVRDFIA